MAKSTKQSTTAGEANTTDAVGGETQPEEQTPVVNDEATTDEAGEVEGLRVKYTGPTIHTRVLTNEDFKRAAGITGVNKATWESDNGHVVVFEDHIEELRTFFEGDLMKNEFKVLKPGES